RGKWNNEEECGSGLLLAKCCHDTDLMCWLANETRPKFVTSLGFRENFSLDKLPKAQPNFASIVLTKRPATIPQSRSISTAIPCPSRLGQALANRSIPSQEKKKSNI
ncbi:MAG: hypothetical protein IKW18_01370, partial [Clostridia bacterium]|nr:hypothetical protein [Clostridia bacterium]